MDSALAPRTDGGRLQTSHERPGLGTLTPTPTSRALGHPALEGGEVNRPPVGEQPCIEVQGEDRLSKAKARRGSPRPVQPMEPSSTFTGLKREEKGSQI